MATGSRLMDKFNERMKKAKGYVDTKEEFEVLYPTGFLALDYLNGSMIHVNGKDVQTKYRSTGIVDGSSNMFIGRSGCGKSTLVFQVIGNIAKQFSTCELYIDDLEGSLPLSRKEFLLGLPKEDVEQNSPTCRVRIRNTGIDVENVYLRIQALHDAKVENRLDYEYDTGLFDTYGNKIFKLVPTIYVIDSFAMLMPKDVVDKEEIDGGMGASKIAKQNTQFIKKISQLLREANIILFSVNHINDDVSTGFMPKPAQISGLNVGERLPGGKAALYIANNIFRLDDGGSLKEDEGFGINGQVVNIKIIKSRTNQNKRSIPLIFNKSEGGFDPILSMFYYLKTEGKIAGAGTSMYFSDLPDVKFSQKQFKEKLAESQELQMVFAKKSRELLDTLLSDTEIKVMNKELNLMDIMSKLDEAS